jgi:hypothetical protein
LGFKTTTGILGITITLMFTLIFLFVCKLITVKNSYSLEYTTLTDFVVYLYKYPSIYTSKWIGLLVFLFSNVVTGVINLSIDATKVSNDFAIFIISIYMFFVYYLGYFIFLKISNRPSGTVRKSYKQIRKSFKIV